MLHKWYEDKDKVTSKTPVYIPRCLIHIPVSINLSTLQQLLYCYHVRKIPKNISNINLIISLVK